MARKRPPPPPDKQDENRNGFPSVAHQFKPGQSGNPNGRPRKKTLAERMADLLESDALEGVSVPEGCCVADVVARAVVINACHGRFPYFKELIDRLEGKVPDRLIDETPTDADADRERSELASLLATLCKRAGVAPDQAAGGPAVPGRDGDGHERG